MIYKIYADENNRSILKTQEKIKNPRKLFALLEVCIKSGVHYSEL